MSGTAAANAFSLGRPVEAGAFAYTLAEDAGGSGGEDWYPAIRPDPADADANPDADANSNSDADANPDADANADPDANPDAGGTDPPQLPLRGPRLSRHAGDSPTSLGFTMIDNYDARMGGGREDFADLPPPRPESVATLLTAAEAKSAIQTGRGLRDAGRPSQAPDPEGRGLRRRSAHPS